MKQVVISGYRDKMGAIGTALFSNLFASSNWGGLPEDSFYTVMPVAGVLRNLRIELWESGSLRSPSAGTSYTFTLRKNSANTSMAITIADAETSGTYTASDIAVAKGDNINLKVTDSGAPNDAYVLVTVEFEATPSFFIQRSQGFNKLNSELYYGFPDGGSGSATAASVSSPVPRPGTAQNFYVSLLLAPDPGGSDGHTFTLMKNGVDTGQTVDITGASTSGEATTDVTFNAGDTIGVHVERIGSPANNISFWTGVTWLDNLEILAIYTNNVLSSLDTSTNKYHPITTFSTWQTNEYNAEQLTPACVVKNFRILLTAAPGTGKSWTFRIRKNRANTDLTISVYGSNTTGVNNSNLVTCSAADRIDLVAEPSDTPAAASVSWGIAVFRNTSNPTPPGEFPSDPMIRVASLTHRFDNTGSDAVYELDIYYGGFVDNPLTLAEEAAAVEEVEAEQAKEDATGTPQPDAVTPQSTPDTWKGEIWGKQSGVSPRTRPRDPEKDIGRRLGE